MTNLMANLFQTTGIQSQIRIQNEERLVIHIKTAKKTGFLQKTIPIFCFVCALLLMVVWAPQRTFAAGNWRPVISDDTHEISFDQDEVRHTISRVSKRAYTDAWIKYVDFQNKTTEIAKLRIVDEDLVYLVVQKCPVGAPGERRQCTYKTQDSKFQSPGSGSDMETVLKTLIDFGRN